MIVLFCLFAEPPTTEQGTDGQVQLSSSLSSDQVVEEIADAVQPVLVIASSLSYEAKSFEPRRNREQTTVVQNNNMETTGMLMV